MNLAELPADFFDDPPARELEPPSTPTARMDEDAASVADVFGDFGSEIADMESSMVDSLKVAGGLPRRAKRGSSLCSDQYLVRLMAEQSLVIQIRPGKMLISRVSLRLTFALSSLMGNLGTSARGHGAHKLIDDLDPDWVLGAPPCTAFSIWNYGRTDKKMDGEAIRTKLAEGRMHLKFCCRMYRRQIRREKLFLHEPWANAMTWSEDCIDKL